MVICKVSGQFKRGRFGLAGMRQILGIAASAAVAVSLVSGLVVGVAVAASQSDTLQAGQKLTAGQFLTSPNGQYQLDMQGDGNLVEYMQGRALWWSGTAGDAGAWVAMQGDGNLVVYSASNQPLWFSGTGGHANAAYYLVVQSDSNVVVYPPSGPALWASYTNPNPSGTSTIGQAIVSAAAAEAGMPYCFDGGTTSGPSQGKCGPGVVGFDCTGLTLYSVYKASKGKIDLPHSGAQATAALSNGGQEITSQSQLQPGDLVFFGGTFANFEHTGVYAGSGMFWDANDNGIPVQEHSMSWEEGGSGGLAFVGGVRF